MATPPITQMDPNLTLTVTTVDNALRILFTTDANGQGLQEVFNFDTGGIGAPSPKATVDLTDVITGLKNKGITSIYLVGIGTNYNGGGRIIWKATSSGKTVVDINENLSTFTSKQWTNQLKF